MESCLSALNKLAKWRSLLAGWQLGTREKGDPEGDAVRDHREVSLILRAEMTALTTLLIEKRVITPEEWFAALQREATLLDADFERRFPGVVTANDGLHIDRHRLVNAGWMKNWKP